MWQENRAQGVMEVLMLLAIAGFIATVVGLIAKSTFTTTQSSVLNQTNAALNKTA